jgi:ribonuclease G
VELKSGGDLIIDQTEAMTTIDVNTGSYVGRRNLEETIFKTNLEAATTLARQLRLRNLGGIIIVDFIDMQDEEHRRQVHRALERAMLNDPVRNQITGVSELGLVDMTRKRTRESLENTLCEDCPVCQGRGVLKTAETVCHEIFREITRDARAYDNDKLLVLAAQSVVDRLLDEESANVADLEEFIGKSISFRVEPAYSQEHFDIVLL